MIPKKTLIRYFEMSMLANRGVSEIRATLTPSDCVVVKGSDLFIQSREEGTAVLAINDAKTDLSISQTAGNIFASVLKSELFLNYGIERIICVGYGRGGAVAELLAEHIKFQDPTLMIEGVVEPVAIAAVTFDAPRWASWSFNASEDILRVRVCNLRRARMLSDILQVLKGYKHLAEPTSVGCKYLEFSDVWSAEYVTDLKEYLPE